MLIFITMPTTVTQATPTSVATHHIDWQGLAGAIFWLVLASLVLFVIGFSTTGWKVEDKIHTGLWESCQCGQSHRDQDEGNIHSLIHSFIHSSYRIFLLNDFLCHTEVLSLYLKV